MAEVCVMERVDRVREAVVDVKRGSAEQILAELER